MLEVELTGHWAQMANSHCQQHFRSICQVAAPSVYARWTANSGGIFATRCLVNYL